MLDLLWSSEHLISVFEAIHKMGISKETKQNDSVFNFDI